MTTANIAVTIVQILVIAIVLFAAYYRPVSPQIESNEAIFIRLQLELDRRDNRIDELETETKDLRREVNGLLGAIDQMKAKYQDEVKAREHLEQEVGRQKTRIVLLESENVLLKKRNAQLAQRLGTSPLGDIENG